MPLCSSAPAPAAALLPPAAATCSYASDSSNIDKRQAEPEDYSLVMKKAGEVAAKVQRNPPEKEVGLVTGAPLEVFKRKVGGLVWFGAQRRGGLCICTKRRHIVS